MAEFITAEATLKGLGPVMSKLLGLPVDLRKKALQAATRKGATVVRNAAKSLAASFDDPKTKERVADNVVVQIATRYNRRTGDMMMRVGVLGGARQYGNTKENVRKGRVGKTFKTAGDKGNPGGDTWYWRFKEFGVPAHGIAAKPFLLPALEQNVDKATAIIASELNKAIDRYAKKAGAARARADI